MGRVGLVLLAFLIVMLACMALGSTTSDNLARANEAQAMIEANRTAQIAVGGLAFSAVTNTMLVALLTLLLVSALVVAGYYAWRYQRLQQQWMPEAKSQGRLRTATNMPVQIGEQQPAARLPSGAMLEQMMQLEMLRTLQELRAGRGEAPKMLPGNSPASGENKIRWGG